MDLRSGAVVLSLVVAVSVPGTALAETTLTCERTGDAIAIDVPTPGGESVFVELGVVGRPGTLLVRLDGLEVEGCAIPLADVASIGIEAGDGAVALRISQEPLGRPASRGFPSTIAFSVAFGDGVEDLLDLALPPSGGGSVTVGDGTFALGASAGTFTGAEDVTVHGSTAGGNTLVATAATVPVALLGGSSTDVLVGGTAADFLSGEAGRDLLDGGPGADVVVGGPGRDRCIVDPADDLDC